MFLHSLADLALTESSELDSQSVWEKFQFGVTKEEMYAANGDTIRDAIAAMQTLPIVGISQKEGGTQLKLIIEFEDGGQASSDNSETPCNTITNTIIVLLIVKHLVILLLRRFSSRCGFLEPKRRFPTTSTSRTSSDTTPRLPPSISIGCLVSDERSR